MGSTYRPVYQDVIDALQHPHKDVRIHAAQALGRLIQDGTITRKETGEVNNHVHTTYSFSPYEPSMAAFKAWEAGLQIVGSADHDSISAADEMRRAAAYIGIASTAGFELRTSFSETSLKDRKINSPDSSGVAYVVVHGVPGNRIGECEEFLKPVQKARNARNRKQVKALNKILKKTDLGEIDFERDVLPLSHAAEGGSLTERHILAALARKIISRSGKGERVIQRLQKDFSITVKGGSYRSLMDPGNQHYLYDLLGVLKAFMLPSFYIEPNASETLPVREVVKFADSIGAIAAYPYLGDVTESPTGDKKAEKFEDSYLEELFEVIRDIGFSSITYMPPRNTKEQLLRLQKLARQYGLMEISGVDINSSRQSFRCPELLEEEFIHLVDAAWALVVHEKLSEHDEKFGLFSPKNPLAAESLETRIEAYSRIGKAMDHHHPENALDYAEEEFLL